MAENETKFGRMPLKSHTKWSSDMTAYMAFMCYTVGMNNLRLLLNYSNQVGAEFMIPYLFCSLFISCPKMILTMGLSQYSHRDFWKFWHIIPAFRAISFNCIIELIIVQVEYNIKICYIAYLAMVSFSARAPWASCNNTWNSLKCFTMETNASRRLDCYDKFDKYICDDDNWRSSYFEYYQAMLVGKSSEDTFRFRPFICLIIISLLLFIITFKGTAILSTVLPMLFYSGVSGLLLLFYVVSINPGAHLGLLNLMKLDLSKVKNSKVWAYAIQYSFVSSGIGLGGINTIAAQLPFRSPAYTRSVFLVVIDVLASVGYYIMYHALYGVVAYNCDTTFASYLHLPESSMFGKVPMAIDMLSGPTRIWMLIFYMHVLLLSLACTTVMTFVVLKTLVNQLPGVEKHFTALCAFWNLLLFCLEVPLCSTVSYALQTAFESAYLEGPAAITSNLLQILVVIVFYGYPTVIDDLHFMMGFRLPVIFLAALILSPVFILLLYGVSLNQFFKTAFGVGQVGDEELTSIKYLQFVFIFFPFLTTAIYFIFYLIVEKERSWKMFFQAEKSWYFKDAVLNRSRQMFTASSMTKEYLYRQSRKKKKFAEDDENELLEIE